MLRDMKRVWRVVRVGFALGLGTAGCGGSQAASSSAPNVAAALLGSRWWATAGAEAFVVHWTDGDHTLWMQGEEDPLQVKRNGDGSSTLTSTGMVPQCYVARTTDDPDAIALWSCSAGKASDPSLGLLRRGAPLIREIPPTEPLVMGPDGAYTSLHGVDPSGRWVVVAAGDQLALWKSDTDRRFDLGQGTLLDTDDNRPRPGMVEFSSDGRYVAYARPTDANGHFELVLYDTTIGAEQILEPKLDARESDVAVSIARFTPDARRIVFYGNLQDDGLHSDLIAVDLTSGERLTLNASTVAQSLYSCLWFTYSDHIVFCNIGESVTLGQPPVSSYEFSTGTRQDLGTILEIVTAPDGSYLALTTTDGQIELFQETNWTPRLLGVTTADPGTPSRGVLFGGMTPSPDGAVLAFVTGDGAFNLYNTRNGTMNAVNDAAGCFASGGPGLDEDSVLLASAAFFLADGQTLIHPLNYGACTNGNGATGIARYDLTTNQEQIVAFEAGSQLATFGPLGDFVYGSVAKGAQLVTWQSAGPPVPLDPAQSFMFTANEQYLLSYGPTNIEVRGLASGMTTTETTSLSYEASVLANPQNGVALVQDNGVLTLYPPAGAASSLESFSTVLEGSPSRAAAIFAEEGAPQFIPLELSARPHPLGHGILLGITDHFAFFTDLDGI
jgi:hypothetical protein